LDQLASIHGRILLRRRLTRKEKPSSAVAEIIWGNTEELVEYAVKVALIGETTFGRNQFQRKAAAVQQ
jgi:hypothetical protein